jgi:hypothetical protein
MLAVSIVEFHLMEFELSHMPKHRQKPKTCTACHKAYPTLGSGMAMHSHGPLFKKVQPFTF